MNSKFKKLAAVAAALTMTVSLGGCAVTAKKEPEGEEIDITERDVEDTNVVQPPEIEVPENPSENGNPAEEEPSPEPQLPTVTPSVKTVSYITATTNGVNLRSGAGTSYSVRGTAEKSTLYALDGVSDGWYKTAYKNGVAYLSAKYGQTVEMVASEDERIEAVIAEGAKLLGTAYVFGAVRYHDGSGKKLSNFTTSAFDCSSLMQYIFYIGAHINLQLTTRTQIYQGKTVTKSQLKRGDLMFFTNESRKNNTGIERVGHVALYLGDNWILHTASDYAKIEQISATRWSYFIQGQRLF